MLASRAKVGSKSLGLIVLDTSYSLAQVQERELQWSITARGCDGTVCKLCRELYPKRRKPVIWRKP